MNRLTPIREHFAGPERLAVAWTAQKRRQLAACEVWLHWAGWELRLLLAGELAQSRVCRSQQELIDTMDEWRLALEEKGWT